MNQNERVLNYIDSTKLNIWVWGEWLEHIQFMDEMKEAIYEQ